MSIDDQAAGPYDRGSKTGRRSIMRFKLTKAQKAKRLYLSITPRYDSLFTFRLCKTSPRGAVSHETTS
ncbi:hypothetical protein ACEQPO_22450 [Bacillus sp. SL00103]